MRSIRSYVRKGKLVNIVTGSFNTITRQMTEMSQRKKQRGTTAFHYGLYNNSQSFKRVVSR